MALTDSLVSYWKCDEASGNLLDAHGTNELTDTNSVGAGTGKINNGRDFESGSSQYFTLADNVSISVADIDFACALWVKLESKAAAQTLVSHWDGPSNQRSWRIEYDSATDRFIFVVSSNGTGGANQVIVTANNLGSPSTGSWYYIVAWHDSVANTVNIQGNNGTVDSASWSAGVHNSTAGFKIGAINATPGQFTDAVLDEIGFWKRVPTAGERTQLYNSGNGLAYPFSTAYTRSVDGSQPAATGTLTRVYQALRSLAGSQPAASGTLTRLYAALRAVAGTMPSATGTLAALTVFLRSLAGTMPSASGALTRTLGALRSLSGSQPSATGVLARTGGAFTRGVAGVLGALSSILSALGGAVSDNRASVILVETRRHSCTITEIRRHTITLSEEVAA